MRASPTTPATAADASSAHVAETLDLALLGPSGRRPQADQARAHRALPVNAQLLRGLDLRPSHAAHDRGGGTGRSDAMATPHPDSFGARDTPRGRRANAGDLPARRARGAVRRRAAAVLAEGPAREPAAHRGRPGGHAARTSRRSPDGTRGRAASIEIAFTPSRVLMQDFTGVPAIVDLAAMRDAMDAAGRRPDADQPARAGRAGDRPLDPGRRVRRAARVPAQRRARVRAQPRALRVPALGPDGVRQLLGRAAEHRHLPPGQPRVPRERRARARRPGVPRHARRDRLAHDDGQRPRRAGLGRRRHRGRGGDARPAGVDADPAGGRLPPDRRAARGRDRDRSRPDRHADAARARRGGQVRRVLRPGPGEPAARRPRDDRQHVARVRRDVRHLPGRRARRCATCGSPAARPSRSSWSRPTAARRGSSTRRARPSRRSRTRSSSTCRRSSRAWPGRAGRRTASRSATRRATSARSCGLRQRRGLPGLGHVRRADASRPATRRRARPRAVAEADAGAPRRRRAGRPHARRRRGPRPRRGGDRGDHELHEHVEPLGHARRGAAGHEGGRGGPGAAAVGQDEPRARARRSSPSTSSARG